MPRTDPAAALADWVAELQQSVRRARARRRVAVGAVAATALMLTTVGAALATDERSQDLAVRGWTADPSRVVREEAGAPVAQVTPAASPGGLTVSARSRTDTVRPGENYTVTVRWRDGDGRLLSFRQDWGDGTRSADGRGRACTATPGASGETSTFHHTWSAPGTYHVTFAVTTISCAGRTETGSVSFPVHVTVPPAPGEPGVVQPAPAQPAPGRPGAPAQPAPGKPGTPVQPSPKPTRTGSPTPTPVPSSSPPPSPSSPSPSPSPVESVPPDDPAVASSPPHAESLSELPPAR